MNIYLRIALILLIFVTLYIVNKIKVSEKIWNWLLWIIEIFYYSLALPLFLGFALLIFQIIMPIYSAWIDDVSWFIKIPVYIVTGIFLRSILKSRYFTQGNKLYVGKISPHLDSEQLKGMLSRYGKVKNMKHYQDEGFAYIEMASPEEAKKVKDALIKDDKDNTLFVVIV